ncbi:MAG: hypothetical protein SGPRY_006183 [Prymnesium sp.]
MQMPSLAPPPSHNPSAKSLPSYEHSTLNPWYPYTSLVSKKLTPPSTSNSNASRMSVEECHVSPETRHIELGWSRAMAKSIRSKVKKRLRTVKRGVIKSQLDDPSSKVGTRRTAVLSKLAEAATGHIAPGERE